MFNMYERKGFQKLAMVMVGNGAQGGDEENIMFGFCFSSFAPYVVDVGLGVICSSCLSKKKKKSARRRMTDSATKKNSAMML
jgi:hypothetical protein